MRQYSSETVCIIEVPNFLTRRRHSENRTVYASRTFACVKYHCYDEFYFVSQVLVKVPHHQKYVFKVLSRRKVALSAMFISSLLRLEFYPRNMTELSIFYQPSIR